MSELLSSCLLSLLLAQAEPKGPERQEPREGIRGYSFKLAPDGRVELTVFEEDKSSGKPVEKTYTADSLEEFKKKYPDLARTYGIERFSGGDEWPRPGKGDFGRKFEEWKKHFGDRWFWDKHHDGNFDQWFKDLPRPFQGDDLKKWIEEQRKLFEKFRGIQPKTAPESPEEEKKPPAGRELGVRVAPLDETLACQLDLEPSRGVIVIQVRAGSTAEQAGVRKHDVLLKLDGKPIEDPAGFRKDVQAALGKGFELGILRKGRPQNLRVPASNF